MCGRGKVIHIKFLSPDCSVLKTDSLNNQIVVIQYKAKQVMLIQLR